MQKKVTKQILHTLQTQCAKRNKIEQNSKVHRTGLDHNCDL